MVKLLQPSEMNVKTGYGQSKIISEVLITKAQSKLNFKTRIMRVGTISGDTRTGFLNRKDMTTNVLTACLCAESVVKNASRKFQWIPVDFVARAVVKLTENSGEKGLFHLCGSGPSFSDFMNVAAKNGINLKCVTDKEWSEAVTKKLNERQTSGDTSSTGYLSLLVARHILSNPEDYFKSSSRDVPMDKTAEFLAKEGLSIPKISEEVMEVYLKTLLQLSQETTKPQQ